jgi:hypothetical protein
MSLISNQQSTISNQQSAINNRQSTIKNSIGQPATKERNSAKSLKRSLNAAFERLAGVDHGLGQVNQFES